MANESERGMRASVSGPYRIAAAIIAIGSLVTAIAFANFWWRGLGNSWLMETLGMFVGAGLFGYAALTGRSPMRQDRRPE